VTRRTGKNHLPKDGRLIAGSVFLSAAGDFIATVPLAVLIADATGSGFAVAGLFAALWAPSVLLARLAGRLVDGIENTRLLFVVSIGQAAVAAAMILAIDSVAAMLALAVLLGSGHAIAQATEFALVPAIADGPRLRRLNGRVETARYLGMTLGPLAGALAAAGGGVAVALAVNALSFALVAVASRFLDVRRRPTARDGTDAGNDAVSDRAPARSGMALLFSGEPLRLAMIVAATSLVFMTGVWAALPFFAASLAGDGALAYAALTSTWTVGMAIGATLLAHRVPAAALAVGAMVAIVVQGAGLALPTIHLSLPLACAFFLLGGGAHGVKNVLLRTLLQEEVPAADHGLAAASYNALRNGAELIALLAGGILVAALGARGSLALVGVLPAVVALIGIAVLTATARRPATAPRPVAVAET